MALTNTFQALSDLNRQRILDILKKGEQKAGDIGGQLDITLPTLSHHLDILKRADLITSRKAGREIFYSLNLSVFEEVEKQLIKFFKINIKNK